MDVENPMQVYNFPVAKLVCIEVVGQPIEDLEREPIEDLEIEPNVVNIQFLVISVFTKRSVVFALL